MNNLNKAQKILVLDELPLVVIVGETSSGKSALAMEIAERFDGEIVCADSRTVYKGMDIGTAKPTSEYQSKIPHHLLDVVAPNESFTVADFKRLANQAIGDIQSRGKLPILVGGSGLYIDAVVFDYHFSETSAPRNPNNPRHLHASAKRDKSDLSPNTLLVGLEVPRDILRQRIVARVDKMVEEGFIDEVHKITELYPGSKALDAPGYQAFQAHLDGRISLTEAKSLFVQKDLRLAKKQRTWFKRNNSIQWYTDPSKIVEIITTLLNKTSVYKQ